MENIFVEFLPPWVETGLQPAFYDKESGTVLQQTARMYARVNMLIRMFNKLSKQTKTTVEEYINKFNELYTYVHDYFDNLDVQEEVNNKLDAMVEDGTINRIINQEIFGELNTQVQQNTTDCAKLPLKVTPKVRRLGRFLIAYGDDKLSTDTKATNYNLQGSCLTSSSTMMMALINGDDTSANLKEFNFKNGQVLREITVNYAGHANGMHKIGDYIYIAGYDGLLGQTITKVDYDTLTVQEVYNFSFPVKTIYQDEDTNKVYIGNDFSVYEWELDTANTTKLFDWNIPNFTINSDGTIQTIAVYKGMIYLVGCYNNSDNVAIFVCDLSGNLYTTWDLGDNNGSAYYGEGQDIMQDGDVFYMTSVFRCGSTLYNDYQIDNVFTFNPYRQIHSDGNLTFLTPSSLRQINSTNTSFFCTGDSTYPYRFYFELALENRITGQNLVGVISGGNQPMLYAFNGEKIRYNLSSATIEGISVTNAGLVINGSGTATIDTPSRRSSHTEVLVNYGADVVIRNVTIGNNSDNKNDYSVLVEKGGHFEYEGLTSYHNIPIYNNGGTIQKSSNITDLMTFNVSRVDPQIVYIPRVVLDANYVAELSVGDNASKIMTAVGRKYLQFNLRFGTTEATCMADSAQNLNGFTYSRDVIIRGNNENNIYFANVTMAYDASNKKFTVTLNSVTDTSGTSVAKSKAGYCTAGVLIIC